MIAKKLLVVALLSAGAAAAQGEEVKTLSLTEAQQVTVKNHPKITAAELIALAS
jgi:hypothetical protein